MTKEKERLVSYILKCIEHGRLTPEETERRLQRIIYSEVCRPLDQPANTELIDLCSALILKLHGAERVTGNMEGLADAIEIRMKQQKKPASRSRRLRFLFAAAALVIIAAVSLGLIRLYWFTSHSTKSQQQYIIEGHEVKTGKSAEADISVHSEDTCSHVCDSTDLLISYLGFDPQLPADIGASWKPIVYNVKESRRESEIACTYALESDKSVSRHIVFILSIYGDPAQIPSYEDLGKGGYLTLAGTKVYRRATADPAHIIWSWRRDNALLSLDAPITAGLPETEVEALILAQQGIALDEPPVFSRAEATPEPLQRQPRITLKSARKYMDNMQGIERIYIPTSLELENLFSFSFGGLDILPEKWSFQQAETICNEASIKVIITYAGVDDSALSFNLDIQVAHDPELQPAIEQYKGAAVEKMYGTDVRVTRNGDRCMFIWSVYPADYCVTSRLTPEEIRPAVSALVAGTMLESEPTFTPAATPSPVPAPTPAGSPQQAVFTASPTTSEFQAITQEMTKRTIALHSQEEPFVTDSLDSLGEYLGYPVTQWDLSPIGWIFNNSRTQVQASSVTTTIQYVSLTEPAAELKLNCHQYAALEAVPINPEQNREGTYVMLSNIQVYTTQSTNGYTYLWQDGLVFYSISSLQPPEALTIAAAWLLGNRTMLEEEPDEDEQYTITEDTVRQAMEERKAAGLSNGRHIAPEQVAASLERLTAQPNRSMISDDLTVLGDHLGFSLDYLSLDALGWKISRGEVHPIPDTSLITLLEYEHPGEPQTDIKLSAHFFKNIEDIYLSLEQDREGIRKTINGYSVYCYTNCGRNGCFWIDNTTLFILNSNQPKAVLERIVDRITGEYSPQALPIVEYQAHQVTGKDLQKKAAERQAAGLPDGCHLTEEQIRDILATHPSSSGIYRVSESLSDAASLIGCPMDHLSIRRIGWDVIAVFTLFNDDNIQFDIICQSDDELTTYARLVIFSFADPADAFYSVLQDGEGAHRNIHGYDVYSYTHGGRPGCVWYDRYSVFQLTAENAEDVKRIAELLISQLK